MWRDARGVEWAWVTPHSFRKTVATLVERERGMAAASSQMGHAGEAVTAKHYVQKRDRAADVTDVLERLSGRVES
ncbi:hypothetical protein [Antrihabitans spumae]|uniref:Tyr recombinase domain-containing protein n=1 Tax=Antrihabitans spumae TaxID=3373370 RepID=A0ABW7KNP3_9NOCA